MLAKFRHHYPQGSIVSELLDLDRGLYLVKVSVRVSGETLATGLAAAERVELAEDRARERAIAALALDAVAITTVEAKPANTEATKLNAATSIEPTQEPTVEYPVATSAAQQPNTHTEESYQVNDSSAPEAGNLRQEISTAELQPDLPSSSSKSNASDGNLFEGTFESQSPISDLNLEPQEDLPNVEPMAKEPLEVNFEDIKHQTDIHIKRLGWTREDGVNFLKSRYGKRSRLHLKDEELLEFLHYLQSQPTPK